jgi:hypothetical protein
MAGLNVIARRPDLSADPKDPFGKAEGPTPVPKGPVGPAVGRKFTRCLRGGQSPCKISTRPRRQIVLSGQSDAS